MAMTKTHTDLTPSTQHDRTQHDRTQHDHTQHERTQRSSSHRHRGGWIWLAGWICLNWAGSTRGEDCFEVQRFQNGVFPSVSYSGNLDAAIDGGRSTSNFGNSDPLKIDGQNPDTTGQPIHALVHWDISALPAGATVHAATITLAVNNKSPNPYRIYEALRPWVESTVTWSRFDAGMPWSTAGAGSNGLDRGEEVLGTTPHDDQSFAIRTVVLNAAGVKLVQDWLDGVRANYGLILVGDPAVGNNGLNLESSEDPSALLRPRLNVHYTLGATSCSPLTCRAVADTGNRMVAMNTLGEFADVGATGVPAIEAMALSLDGATLFAPNGSQLGALNLTTGTFSAIGSGLGTAGGALGEIALNDVDGLSFDPLTGWLYAVQRRATEGDADLLFRIDPVAGTHVSDAFGVGTDYVLIGLLDTGGGVILDNIDDLAFDPATGELYGIANQAPFGLRDHLVKIDPSSGAISDVGKTRDVLHLAIDDVEGLSFDRQGRLFMTTGDVGVPQQNRDSLWTVDKASGVAIAIAGFPQIGTPHLGDYEALTCWSAAEGE